MPDTAFENEGILFYQTTSQLFISRLEEGGSGFAGRAYVHILLFFCSASCWRRRVSIFDCVSP